MLQTVRDKTIFLQCVRFISILHLVVFQTWTGQEVGYGSEPPGRTATLLECLHAVLRVQGGEEIEQNAEVRFPFFLFFALSDPGRGNSRDLSHIKYFRLVICGERTDIVVR